MTDPPPTHLVRCPTTDRHADSDCTNPLEEKPNWRFIEGEKTNAENAKRAVYSVAAAGTKEFHMTFSKCSLVTQLQRPKSITRSEHRHQDGGSETFADESSELTFPYPKQTKQYCYFSQVLPLS